MYSAYSDLLTVAHLAGCRLANVWSLLVSKLVLCTLVRKIPVLIALAGHTSPRKQLLTNTKS